MDFGSTDKRLATITNTFCYYFPCAPKDVSYVAPAYVADRMCGRGRAWSRRWKPASSLKLRASNNGVTWDAPSITQWKQNKTLELLWSVRLNKSSTERAWGRFDDQGQMSRCNP
jgi:hypothetical protein